MGLPPQQQQPPPPTSSRWKTLAGGLVAVIAVSLTVIVLSPKDSNSDRFRGGADGVGDAMKKAIEGERKVDDAPKAASDKEQSDATPGGSEVGLPPILYKRSVYSESDFENGPTFWNQSYACAGTECAKVWGPCFPPQGKPQLEKEIERLEQGGGLKYYPRPNAAVERNSKNVDDLCRPGFLIIGQGKCGTSSLYHYLGGHSRVLPASEKQIHYFKYYSSYSMRWYMTHFPSATSFVASGALMTGEASPGYLPYPDVAALVAKRLPGTKIICVGRDPLERSYSSYQYNYVNPAIAKLRKGRVRGIKGGQPDDYYQQYLFSFEEMMKAELATLKKCLAPNGPGETGAAESWSHTVWGKTVYEQRAKDGLPKLVDIDGHCYGKFYSSKAPRKQWIELSKENPDKFLGVPNIHLSQAMIGRSLYTYPLEWWYAMFPEEDVYFLCTEEMRDLSGNPLSDVSDFLGLPPFNFSGVVSEGMYNVGGHKGYDEMTSWQTVEEEHSAQEDKDAISLSPEFRKELMDFLKPHNERLFKLVGRRCNWQTV